MTQNRRGAYRAVHVCTSHGVGMPALRKAAAAEMFALGAEAQFAKGRQRPRTTKVSRYVDRRAPAVSRGIAKILQKHGKRAAERARTAAAALLAKDDATTRERILRIIEELDFEDLGLDLDGELTTAILAAFKRAAELGLTEVGIAITDEITDQLDEAALEFAREHGGVLIKDLAGTTEDAMSDVLERAVEEGWSTDRLADAIEEMGAFGPARAETIARTELAYAHVQGNVEGWRQSGEVVGKRWLLADTHPEPDECDDAVDAGVVGFEDEFVDGIKWPPAHPNACFEGTTFASYGEPLQLVRARYCGPAVFLEAERSGHGVEPFPGHADGAPNFRDLPAAVQKAPSLLQRFYRRRDEFAGTVSPDRVRLTIGPNHPMLTRRGFVPARELQEGDELVYDALAQDARIGAVKADLEKVMCFEDAFRALAAVCGSSRVAGAASYFHGDEAFIYGEVDAVRPERGLLPVLDPGGLKHAGELNLMRTDARAENVPAARDGGSVLGRLFLSAHGVMGRLRDLGALVRCQRSPPRFHAFRVVSRHVGTFEGFAFDASTSSGFYSNGGLVVKNCLCDVLPVLSGDENAPPDDDAEEP